MQRCATLMHRTNCFRRIEEMPGDTHRHAAHPTKVATQIEHDAVGISQRVDGGAELRHEHGHPNVETDNTDTTIALANPFKCEVRVLRRQIAKTRALPGLALASDRQQMRRADTVEKRDAHRFA